MILNSPTEQKLNLISVTIKMQLLKKILGK